ncbi:MAG: (4Fe-4S)-binding protein [Bacteroidota bacterium]|nr:(4Fe-4S)-binding protein [Bacteroidota bacterium]
MVQKVFKYSNGELTIIWQPEICQHSGVCARTLPAVYRPRERPWIRIENATTSQLMDQISKCPSGALSYLIHEHPTDSETK